jgi:hypothetical protein
MQESGKEAGGTTGLTHKSEAWKERMTLSEVPTAQALKREE